MPLAQSSGSHAALVTMIHFCAARSRGGARLHFYRDRSGPALSRHASQVSRPPVWFSSTAADAARHRFIVGDELPMARRFSAGWRLILPREHFITGSSPRWIPSCLEVMPISRRAYILYFKRPHALSLEYSFAFSRRTRERQFTPPPSMPPHTRQALPTSPHDKTLDDALRGGGLPREHQWPASAASASRLTATPFAAEVIRVSRQSDEFDKAGFKR